MRFRKCFIKRLSQPRSDCKQRHRYLITVSAEINVFIYIVFTIHVHLIEQNIFNTKLQVVYLFSNIVIPNKETYISTYSVSIGFASKCMITIVRSMFDMPFKCLLQISEWYLPKTLAFEIVSYFRGGT